MHWGITMNRSTSFFVILLSATYPALAQQPDPALPDDNIIVTATRSRISLDDAIVPATVIGRDEIELSGASDLSELLRFEAGLDIARNGGPGQTTSLFLRGTESNHTLVLVDGVRINPGTIGGAAIQHIAPEVIERVEIVKGTRSSLFGTDAIGGVVNVITRRAAAPFAEMAIGGGSYDTRSASVNGGAGGENGEFGVNLNWNSTDGYAIRTDSDIERGYDNLTANLYGVRRFSFGEVGIRHWQTSGNVEYLDFFLTPVDQDFTVRATALELSNDISERSHSQLLLGYFVDDIEQRQSDDFVTSKRLTLDWQYGMEFEAHSLAGGVYLSDENAESLSFGAGFDEGTRVNAVFLQDRVRAGRHSAFVALRYTDHETFGAETTGNAEYAFEVTERWTVRAGVGRGFRAPDATDRFGFGGNVDLRPEVANELQVGAAFRPTPRQKWRLELFRNDIDDLIEFDFVDFTLENIGKAEIRGAQIGYEYRGERFALRADALRQTAENAIDGTRLLRRPEKSLTVGFTQNLGLHRAGISVLAVGDREDFGERLPGYVLANLTGQFRLAESWQVNARLENVLDTDYETAANYKMMGRSVFVDVKYRWE